MKTIKLSGKHGVGRVALIDDEDYELVSKYRWIAYKARTAYYARCNYVKNGKNTSTSMHRLLLGFPDGEIDHKDFNGLNNQRANIRVCTKTENSRHKNILKRNTTGYKGVYFCKERSVYQAKIFLGKGKSKYLGSHKNAIDGAIAYNLAAQKYFGEFAHLNNIQQYDTERGMKNG